MKRVKYQPLFLAWLTAGDLYHAAVLFPEVGREKLIELRDKVIELLNKSVQV